MAVQLSRGLAGRDLREAMTVGRLPHGYRTASSRAATFRAETIVIQRTLNLILTLSAFALLVTLAVTNTHPVDLKLDPFNPDASGAPFIRLPFFVYLFAMLMIGVILGGIANWFSQGKWRRAARNRTQEALRWKAEADRLMRERDAGVARNKQLTRV